MTQIAPNTPVIIGAGQYTERLDSPDYRALSPVDITAQAATIAINDAGNAVCSSIDCVMTTRTFEDSTPVLAFPFGRSNNFPRSVCGRLGLEPSRAVWAASGGDSPQKLVVEACEAIVTGSARAVLVCGGEALSTAKHRQKMGLETDWSETIDAQVEDRGAGIDYLLPQEIGTGLLTPPLFHGLIENARRAQAGATRSEWARHMAELFAPFSAYAASNPLAAVHQQALDAQALMTVGEGNRMVADPYPQRLVARDQVNMSAALVLVSSALADQLGVPADRRIYLQAHAHAAEPPVTLRRDIGSAPSAGLALKAALESAGLGTDAIDYFDFYSCFPVAVSNAIEAIGLAADDPRGLTITGGLPYFGGPGNNYSMHALAEMVQKLRQRPGSLGLVAANGGFLSKYAVGLYSTMPASFTAFDEAPLADAMRAHTLEGLAEAPTGTGVIETYTLNYDRSGSANTAIAVGRVDATGERFLARNKPDDMESCQTMRDADPIGRQVRLHAAEGFTTFDFQRDN